MVSLLIHIYIFFYSHFAITLFSSWFIVAKLLSEILELLDGNRRAVFLDQYTRDHLAG